jgi:phospholipase C
VIDRRAFLRGAAALGAGVALRPWPRLAHAMPRLPEPAGSPAAPTPAALRQIEHVVFLIQENRSYDHYFGAYRRGRGFDDHPPGSPGVFAQRDGSRTTGTPIGQLLPWHLDTKTMNAACTDDPTHAWFPQHSAWNGGAMDRFMSAHNQFDGRLVAPFVMGYYTRADLPLYYALADSFTLCDHYFCSVLSESDPNRLYSISATIDPDGVAGGPVFRNAASVSAVPPSKVATNAARYTWTTMPERLQAQGVSWKAYQDPGSLADTGNTNNYLIWFRQFSDPSTELYRAAFLPRYPHDFVADVEAGTLPSVSWVFAPPGQDEHPPHPSSVGELVTRHVVQTLVRNPKVWAKTVLFITYDENGGFFDHVPPPTAPPGTPGEYLAANQASPFNADVLGPIGLGFRVSMLVVSPFSRGGIINSDVADHTSMLRFLETRFGVEVPNLSAWRRATTSDLTSTLSLDRPPRLKAPPLPAGIDASRVKKECAGVPAEPPLHQQLPAQRS